MDAQAVRPAVRCVFLGDCAHATSPQLGQGANLALVDAWVLGNVIGEATRGVPKGEQDDPVLPSLQEFDRQRRWRLRFYQLNSRMLTPVFQSNSRAIGALRDLFMGPLCCGSVWEGWRELPRVFAKCPRQRRSVCIPRCIPCILYRVFCMGIGAPLHSAVSGV